MLTGAIGNRNPGIVPPWLTKPVNPEDPGNGNPGIVPPWLTPETPVTPRPLLPPQPVADEVMPLPGPVLEGVRILGHVPELEPGYDPDQVRGPADYGVDNPVVVPTPVDEG
jgi:hypothetical protein